MALDKQIIDIPTTDGIDTKTDSVNDTPPAMSDINNLRFTNTGAYDPRESFSALQSLTATATDFVVGARDSVFSSVDGYLYKTIEGSNQQLAPIWNPKTRSYRLGGTYTSLGSGTSSEKPSAVALTNGGVFYVWSKINNTAFGYQFLTAEGDLLTSNTVTPTSDTIRYLRVSAGPNGSAVVWYVNASNVLKAFLVTASSSTALTLPVTSMTSVAAFYDSTANCWFVATVESSAPKIYKMTLSGSTLSTVSSAAPSISSAYDVDVIATSNYIALGVAHSTTVSLLYYNSSLSLQFTQTRSVSTATTYAFSFGICQIENDDVFANLITYSSTDGLFLNSYKFTTSSAANVWDSASVGFYVVTTPIAVNKRIYVRAIDAALAGTQSSALVQIANFDGGTISKIEVVTTWAADSVGGNELYGTAAPSNLRVQMGNRLAKTSTKLAVPYLYLGEFFINSTTTAGNTPGIPDTLIESVYTVGPFFVGAIQFDLVENAAAQAFELGSSVSLVGTGIRSIDGAGQGPSSPWPSVHPLQKELLTSGTLTNGALYTYVFVKVWTDSLGNRQILEGFPIQVRPDATYNRFKCYFPPSAFYVYNTATGGTTEAVIEVYKTEPDGVIPYWQTTLTGSSASPYIDSASTVATQFPLPSSSGELPTTVATGAACATVWKGRLVTIPIDAEKALYYTKPTETLRAPAFASGLQIDIPQSQEPLTALGAMDGVLYVFTPNQVYTVYGDPAGNTGENSSLTIPEIRFNGIGCAEPASVVLAPPGLFFKSAKGIYLILRNQELQFVGTGPFDARSSKVVGSWADESTSEVAFTLDTGDIWVYDWVAKAWSRWTPPRGTGDLITGANLINSRPTYITPDAIYQTVDTNSETFSTSVTTAWIRLGALQGYQRVYSMWLYLERLAAHTLTIDLYIDGNDTTSVYTWSIPSSGLASSTPEQIRLSMPVQKCSAAKLKISSTNAGWTLKGITAEIGVKPTTYKSRNAPNNY